MMRFRALLAAAVLSVWPIEAALADGTTVIVGPRDQVTSYMIGDQIGTGIGNLANAYADYTQTRANWDGRIYQLQSALSTCGDCKDRKAIEDELGYWKQEKEIFEKVSVAILDAFSDPKTADYEKILLGLPRDPEFIMQERPLTPDEYSQLLKNRHVSEKCVPLFVSAYSCEIGKDPAGDPLHGTSCDLRRHVASICTKQNDADYHRALDVLFARQKGVTLPLVTWKAEKSQFDFYYGDVDDTFVPTIPPIEKLDAAGASHLNATMTKKGLALLTNVYLKKENRNWEIACDYGVRLEDLHWQAYDPAKLCPLEMPF
jgi:hypothetical protein